MNPISNPPSKLGKSYQIIVVGSGYGGGVAASRLARAGQKVCVLERGREILPGKYPDTLPKANAEMQIDTEDGLIGSPVGLYNMHMNPDVNVIVGCGLGGTSLINANVALEMDPRQFEEDGWPEKLLPDPTNKDSTGKPLSPLDKYYKHARDMLGSTPYPETYPPLNKLDALERAAEYIGERENFYRPDINVTFEDQVNKFGVEQPACTRCGDCCSGCNVGSKNTTLMNYLPDAANHGAEIFTLCRVEHLERIAKGEQGYSDGERWKVHVQTFKKVKKVKKKDETKWVAAEMKEVRKKDETKWVAAEMKEVRAEMVILAAGTLGSAEILLRSGKKGLSLSPALGKCFSGNGDVVALGYNCYWENEDKNENGTRGTRPGGNDILDEIVAKAMKQATEGEKNDASTPKLNPKPIYGIGVGANKVDEKAYPGPCITGIIDLRDHPDPEKRLVIEEGVIPGALASGLPPGLFFGNVLAGNPGLYGPSQMAARLVDAQTVAEAIQNSPTSIADLCYKDAVARSQTYLVMSHDRAQGRLKLGDSDRVRVDWKGAGRSPVIEHDNAVLEQVNLAVQGEFLSNPLWTEPLGNQLVTVHPVGGCRMSDSPTKGVVNDRCEVYTGSEDGAVHDGLFVCDGAVMPGAVGVNPLLTISAVAERAMHLLCEEKGWTYDTSLGDVEAPVEHGGIWKKLLEGVRALVRRGQERGEMAREESEESKDSGHEDPIKALAAKILKTLANWFPQKFSPSLGFDEVMTGYISLTRDIPKDERPASERVSDDYALCFDEGKKWVRDSHQLKGCFTVKAETIWKLTSDPLHPATISGKIICEALAFTKNSEMKIIKKGSTLNLLKVDEGAVETWVMTYCCKLEPEHGMDPDDPGVPAQLFFKGKKILHKKDGSFLWTDVTRLFVDVYRGEGAEEKLIARGIINLGVSDLLRQAQSLTMEPASNIQQWLKDHAPSAVFDGLCTIFLAKFAGFFGMTLFRAYGGLMSDLANFAGMEDEERQKARRTKGKRYKARPRHTMEERHKARHKNDKAPQPAYTKPVSYGSNRWKFSLTRYQGGEKGPVILAPGFAVAASSFAALTVKTNLVEYLTDEEYDVWLFDYQGSPNSGHATDPFTIDDIVEQWKQAIDFVYSAAGDKKVQAVAHCMGSMTLLMALMDDLGLKKKVKSAVHSQTTLHPVTNWLNYVKTDLRLASIIEDKMGVVDLCTLDPGKLPSKRRDDEVKKAKTLDTMLWSVPVPPGEECTNPVCRRVFSLFGPAWTHAQLNHDTHIALREWFGKISAKPFEQLAKIMRIGYPVTADGEDKYMPKVKGLELPLTFLAGEKNRIFLTETSRRTDDWLCAHNGDINYRRIVFEGYAHMDFFVGKTAHEDIFPHILEALDHPPGRFDQTDTEGKRPLTERGRQWRWTKGMLSRLQELQDG